MPRVKLREQNAYPFVTDLDLHDDDMNHAGHLGFDRILSVAQRAWNAMFVELGVHDTDLGDGTTGVIVSDVAVNYRAEAFVGQRLRVAILPFEIDVSSLRLALRVEIAQTSRLVALLELGLVAFNYRERCKGRFPVPVAQGIAALAD